MPETDNKKKGALYKEDTDHISSQDNPSKHSQTEENSEEE